MRDIWGRREYGWFSVLVVASICERVGRVGREMRMLAAAFQAGTLRVRRSPAPGLTRRKPTPPALPALPDPMKLVTVPLPRSHGWLVKRAAEVRLFGYELEQLLQDPEMQALLAASPRAVRTIRPLCRMLGIASPKLPASVPPTPAPPGEPAGETISGPVPAGAVADVALPVALPVAQVGAVSGEVGEDLEFSTS